ncbi:hypothetical protein MTR_4g094888 [Medicago truncatula]|uniref:Uncharacterized protein n=1 Tax=Medicago truncatula TaxID=3880 RepID=A0A072V043_MEDTR|nr:hypothetical protein MTR_4g094888 [Medicago truncatula]
MWPSREGTSSWRRENLRSGYIYMRIQHRFVLLSHLIRLIEPWPESLTCSISGPVLENIPSSTYCTLKALGASIWSPYFWFDG